MKLDVPFKNPGSISKDLVEELKNIILPEHWLIDTTRNTMGNLEKTDSIIFRYFDSYSNALSSNWKESIVDKPIFSLYKPTVLKILDVLKQHYIFSNYMSFLARLAPRSDVGIHSDSSEFLETCHRIHIPIVTNNLVYYIIDGVKYNWAEGQIYEFDNTRLHGVENQSDHARIHLMFNLYR